VREKGREGKNGGEGGIKRRRKGEREGGRGGRKGGRECGREGGSEGGSERREQCFQRILCMFWCVAYTIPLSDVLVCSIQNPCLLHTDAHMKRSLREWV